MLFLVMAPVRIATLRQTRRCCRIGSVRGRSVMKTWSPCRKRARVCCAVGECVEIRQGCGPEEDSGQRNESRPELFPVAFPHPQTIMLVATLTPAPMNFQRQRLFI
jgi:hypothetical protein